MTKANSFENNIVTPKIYSLIKTPCGRAKYLQLSQAPGPFAKLRLYWFISFAALRDLTLKNPDNI